DASQLRDVATEYTAGPSFPPQFAQANRGAHRAMLAGDHTGSWVIDLAPMLTNSFAGLLSRFNIAAPSTIPLTVALPEPLTAGQLQAVAGWGRWATLGAMAVTGAGALLTLFAARRRGRALAALGVSA